MKHLIIADENKSIIEQYDIDECLWSEVLHHYVKLRQTDVNIGECLKIINDNLHKRSSSSIISGRVIDRLSEINKFYAYIKDVSGNDCYSTLQKIDQGAANSAFLEFIIKHCNKRCNIIDFFNDFYCIDLKNSISTAEVWTKMKPLSDEGKTRGYSGPSEMPLLLFAGGCKANKGDMLLLDQMIEIKGEGGRIGEYSKWCNSKQLIDKFLNQFNEKANVALESQAEFNFGNLLERCLDHLDFSMLPFQISQLAKHCVINNVINTRNDALIFIGCIQLIEYMQSKVDDWFVLFKHPGKNTAPFGTSFVLNCKEFDLSNDNVVDLINHCKAASVCFSPCYDNGGYKIKFAK